MLQRFIRKLDRRGLVIEQAVLFSGLAIYSGICFSGICFSGICFSGICFSGLFDWLWVGEVLRAGVFYVVILGFSLPLSWYWRSGKDTLSFWPFGILWLKATLPLGWSFVNDDAQAEGLISTKWLKVFYANVLTSNEDSADLISLVKSELPDLVLLEEVDARWISSLQQGGMLAEYPYRVEKPRSDNF